MNTWDWLFLKIASKHVIRLLCRLHFAGVITAEQLLDLEVAIENMKPQKPLKLKMVPERICQCLNQP